MQNQSVHMDLIRLSLRAEGTAWLLSTLDRPLNELRQYSLPDHLLHRPLLPMEVLASSEARHCGSLVLEALFDASELVPATITYLCGRLNQYVESKFPGAGQRALTNYLFLNFIVPALSSPDWIPSSSSDAEGDLHGKLALASRLIQAVANGWEPLPGVPSADEWLLEMRGGLQAFLSTLSKVSSPSL